VFVWARVVRDSCAQVLPFSALGGFVLGARALTLHGVSWAEAAATTMVDVTAEFMAELIFALVGLAILAAYQPKTGLVLPVVAGVSVALAAIAGFVWVQRGASGLVAPLARRIMGERLPGMSGRLRGIPAELDRIYGRPGRIALSVTVHLTGWVGTGLSDWVAYRLIGVPISFPAAVAIAALLHAALTATFLVPGGAGVQELAYAALGTAFGAPPQISLAVSLLRRGRDLLIGVPVLLAWQGIEVRRLRERGVEG
jgi:putative membrane protein